MKSIYLGAILSLVALGTEAARIKGRIKDYNYSHHSSTIRAVWTDYATHNDIYAISPISDQGQFLLEIELDHRAEVTILYDIRLPFILAPNDHISVEFASDDPRSVQIRSPESDIRAVNELVSEFLIAEKQAVSFPDTNEMWSIDGWAEFQAVVLSTMENRLSHLHQFTKDKQVKDSLFIRWAFNNIRYEAWTHILSYPLFNAHEQNIGGAIDITFPEGYLDFMSGTDQDSPEAMVTGWYSLYLHYLGMVVQVSFSQDKKPADFGSMSAYSSAMLHNIKENTYGLGRDVVLTRLFMRAINSPMGEEMVDSNLEFFDKYAANEYLKGRFFQKYNELHDETEVGDIAARIDTYPIPDSVRDVLRQILVREKGKVVYVDVWATWCKPCHLEMPSYSQLISDYSEKNLEFVFLAFRSPRNLWLKSIEKYGLQGARHYLLSENLYDYLQQILNIQGVPHHVLIGRDGQILRNFAPGPSNLDDAVTAEWVQMIEAALK